MINFLENYGKLHVQMKIDAILKNFMFTIKVSYFTITEPVL